MRGVPGRTMVPTPHALAIHAEVRAVVDRARGLFAAAGGGDLRTLNRTFTVLAHDAFAAAHGPALFARTAAEAPGVRLRFLGESHLDAPTLRDGVADLEAGVIDTTAPEVHIEPLHEDRMLGVVRSGHPLLDGPLTPARFAAGRHIGVSRRGRLAGPIDAALAGLGLARTVVGTLATYPAALFVLCSTDLIGLVTTRSRGLADALGLVTFEIPLDLPMLSFGLAWHPRHDADPAHAWLRGCIRERFAAG